MNTNGQGESNAAAQTETRIPELTAEVKELQPEEAARVNGGIIAVLIGLVQPPEPDKSRLNIGVVSSTQP